ncbi:MAG: histidine phosphatase family protein [Fusobacterium sp. JB021]|nr:histidine phosphatase family protein [Fusobacterium sp. JB020]MDP0494052.1 histidine phosphatase family protein [Fusobacterium sp. JB021]MDP0507357.1 histidine phosphatase family protein [Fusobacterium sp. JB019]
MSKIILIRHGETDMNKDNLYHGILDPELNNTGIKQAEKAYDIVKNLDYDKIFSSNLKRAYETAEILNYKNLNIEISDKIRELNFGIFEGLSYNQISKKYPKELEIATKNWKTYDFKTGESPLVLQKRAVEFINSLDKNLNYLIVTHWGIICTVLSYYFSGNLDAYWKFKVNNCGIIIIEFDENNFPILAGFNIGG